MSIQSVNNMASHSVCTLWMYQYCVFIFGLMMVPLNRNVSPNFNIAHCIYCIVVLLAGISHYFIAIHNGWLLSKSCFCRIYRHVVSVGHLTWDEHVDISPSLSHDKMNQIVWGLFQYELLVKQASCATVETLKAFCHVSARGFCRDFNFALSFIWGPR